MIKTKFRSQILGSIFYFIFWVVVVCVGLCSYI